MIHEGQFQKRELYPGKPEAGIFASPSTLPTILKREFKEMDVVTDGSISVGDVILPCFFDKGVTVAEIIEARPAKGNCTGQSYKGQMPTWSKILTT